MKVEKIVCEHCGQSFRPHNTIWYSQQISQLLKLKPEGKALDGSPYYNSWRKAWLIEVYKAVRDLVEK